MAQFKIQRKFGNVTRQIGGGFVLDGVAIALPPSPSGYVVRSILASVNAARVTALAAGEVNGGATLLIGRGDPGDNSQNPILSPAKPLDPTTGITYDETLLVQPVQTNVPLLLTFPEGTSPFRAERDQPLVIALSDAVDETGVKWTNTGILSLTVYGTALYPSETDNARVRLR